jgi:Zn-dependent protease with chaperone function
MRVVRKQAVWIFILVTASALLAQQRTLKPGFNLFSKEQDIQMGKEYAAQVNKQMPMVRDQDIVGYVQRIGAKLAAAPEANGYPYTFQVVQDKSINAFALPGGPTFTHTGLIAAADNEAQIAGVLAHEIAHVALRHGTNQASKAQLWSIPAMLAGGLAGEGITGQLAQLGIGLGLNSVLLKYSRNAERDADLLGARMMARAGYNPIEMARFFEKLEAESGGGSALGQFFSDHPNPGNRVKSVQEEIRYLPRRDYTNGDTAQLARMKQQIASMPDAKRSSSGVQADPEAIAQARPSSRLREYRGQQAVFSHPENWEVLAASGNSVTIASKAGVAGNAIAYGMIADFFDSPDRNASVESQTEALLKKLVSENQGMQTTGNSRRITVNGHRALLTSLQSPSSYPGTREVDTLLTVQRPGGLFYLVLVAPEKDWNRAGNIFDQIVRSVRFPN